MSGYVLFGAAGGIGSSICRMLRSGGSELYLAGRSEEGLKTLGQELDVPWQTVDATSFERVSDCLSRADEALGTVDGVVNCVGSVVLQPAHLMSEDDWHATLAVNLTSAFAVVRGSYKVLRKAGGSIVLFSSGAVRTGLPNHEAIAASKAGVEGLTRSAAASYAGRKIRVNAVAPGLIKTRLTERIWSRESAADASRSLHALGRLGEPEDVARLVVWLLQPENEWITGQVWGVDGGLSAVRVPSREV